eukprot:TRINITY_DN11886_c0_g1_i2.p1 TRINITY_DN11886_c0_g1~~TRINITY_DN11886_c0_g1_i2.p1  ORF type:complete len:233 (+),score=40.42 TRINITY_DN11886_c0_g1_i2:235-933(+)
MVAEGKGSGVRGHLLITVEEASGRNKHDTFVWDHNNFEGFVKAELRGGEKPVKAQSSKAQVQGTSLTWKEDLKLEVLEGSNELRLMLCREKPASAENKRSGISVIAACGIYVNDILDAVPIDKYFELFKPTQGGEGGYIRVRLNYSATDNFPETNQNSTNVDVKLSSNRANLSFQGYTAEDFDVSRLPTVSEENKGGKKGGCKRGFFKFVTVFGIVIAGIIVGAGKLINKQG